MIDFFNKTLSLADIKNLQCIICETTMIYAGPYKRKCPHNGVCNFVVYYISDGNTNYRISSFNYKNYKGIVRKGIISIGSLYNLYKWIANSTPIISTRNLNKQILLNLDKIAMLS